MSALKFRDEVKRQETRVMGLLVVKVAWSTRVADGYTDRQTANGRTDGR